MKIDNFTFSPADLTVAPGTTVTWVNGDDIPHTVVATSGAFRSRALDTEDMFSFTFARAGEFEYFCSLHPHMTGRSSRQGDDRVRATARLGGSHDLRPARTPADLGGRPLGLGPLARPPRSVCRSPELGRPTRADGGRSPAGRAPTTVRQSRPGPPRRGARGADARRIVL